MSKFAVTAVAVAALAALLAYRGPGAAPAQDRPAPAVRWEYKVLNTVPVEKELNRLGEDGWELATLHMAANVPVYAVFKRPRR